MIDIYFVLRVHKILIGIYGGEFGIRDNNLLDSAINRPFQTFDGKELYQTVIEKAAAQIQSIIVNHPFVDGNKRVGYFLLRWFLLRNNYDFNTNIDSRYKFIIQIAYGNYSFESIKEWFRVEYSFNLK
ncbi:MAG: type II toxin-antitoxin system death-on-curing family toxin [Ignavibacteria bacterium]|nr:type II toxin-antitoxin system death-on-curing family toxin [Ignavibacteria bacterium]